MDEPTPAPLQTLQYFTPPHAIAAGTWRDGKRLITFRQSTLPPFCVKCNAPAELRLGKFSCLNSWRMTSTRAQVRYGLCQHHRTIRRGGVVLAWLCVLLTFVLPLIASLNEPYLALSSIPLALLAAFLGLSRTLRPVKMDDKLVWFSGACSQYLDQFPTEIK